MAQYYKDANGKVHVRDQGGNGEYTACGYAFDACGNDYDEIDDGADEMKFSRGPSTCDDCKDAVELMRATVKGVRFRKTH